MLLLDSIPLAEPLQDVDSLRSQLPQATLEGEHWHALSIGQFDESGIHEPLAHRPGHLLRHRKGGGRGGRDDSAGVFGVRHAVRLRELERAQVVDGLLRRERKRIRLEAEPVR